MNNAKQKKEAIQYPRFIKHIIIDSMKKFLEIPKRIEEDYHSIKDDIPLVSVYTTGDMRVRGMLILDAFLTKEIHDIDDFKEYETMLEPGSHKDNTEHVDDDDKDDKKVDKEEGSKMGSLETRTKETQTPIPSTPRSPRNVSSSDKTIREVLDHCNKVVPDTKFAKTKEMITQEMPRLVNLTVNKDCEVDPINSKEMIAKEFATHGPKMIEELFQKHMQNTTLNLYPTTSTSTTLNHLLIFNINCI
ncbi:hypothetical protein Tco_1458485 [Tanacetum coccineum]